MFFCAYTPKRTPHRLYTDAFWYFCVCCAVCALFRSMISITSANIALVVKEDLRRFALTIPPLSFTLSITLAIKKQWKFRVCFVPWMKIVQIVLERSARKRKKWNKCINKWNNGRWFYKKHTVRLWKVRSLGAWLELALYLSFSLSRSLALSFYLHMNSMTSMCTRGTMQLCFNDVDVHSAHNKPCTTLRCALLNWPTNTCVFSFLLLLF